MKQHTVCVCPCIWRQIKIIPCFDRTSPFIACLKVCFNCVKSGFLLPSICVDNLDFSLYWRLKIHLFSVSNAVIRHIRWCTLHTVMIAGVQLPAARDVSNKALHTMEELFSVQLSSLDDVKLPHHGFTEENRFLQRLLVEKQHDKEGDKVAGSRNL